MGTTTSLQREAKTAKDRSDAIDEIISGDRVKAQNNIDILLLEYEDSGMTGLLKQMKSAHNDYNDAEKEVYRHTILLNTMDFMSSLLDALIKDNISLSSEAGKWQRDITFSPSTQDPRDVPFASITALHNLWQDPAVKKGARCGKEHGLNETAAYYLESIDRLTVGDYSPTYDDIVRCQPRTTGIEETCFSVGEMVYRIFNPRRLKGDKRKWWPCFEAIPMIIFCVSVTDYDQLHPSDGTNRMIDAFQHFDSLCNSVWFRDTAFVCVAAILMPDALQ